MGVHTALELLSNSGAVPGQFMYVCNQDKQSYTKLFHTQARQPATEQQHMTATQVQKKKLIHLSLPQQNSYLLSYIVKC